MPTAINTTEKSIATVPKLESKPSKPVLPASKPVTPASKPVAPAPKPVNTPANTVKLEVNPVSTGGDAKNQANKRR